MFRIGGHVWKSELTLAVFFLASALTLSVSKTLGVVAIEADDEVAALVGCFLIDGALALHQGEAAQSRPLRLILKPSDFVRTPDLAAFDAVVIAVDRFDKIVPHVHQVVLDCLVHQELDFIVQDGLIPL